MKIELKKVPIKEIVNGYSNDDLEGVTGFGGKTVSENCQMLCVSCNRKKSGK
jgi:5-methylcytosine-specific restriction endonuclease McrA